jgi:hypothetical protein
MLTGSPAGDLYVRECIPCLKPADYNVQGREGAIFKLDQGFLMEL